jgi:hypothetical protein
MGEFGGWLLPIVAVVMLAAATLLFALYIGRWIDAQGNSVVGKPRERRRRGTRDNADDGDGGD